GDAILPNELAALVPPGGGIGTVVKSEHRSKTYWRLVPLIAGADVVGGLVLKGDDALPYRDDLMRSFANALAALLQKHSLRLEAMRNSELEERDRWRRALLGSVSHDLRTPLASLTTSASTLAELKDELTSDQREELLATIERQSLRLARLVENLLDSSRIEANMLAPRIANVDTRELIDEALGAFGEAERALVHVSFDESIPSVAVDHVLVAQALANLIENGLRYCEPSTGVDVSATSAESRVEIGVRDRGPGVDPSLKGRIFGRFEKGAGSPGAGLGLWIAQSFVELNGGVIRFRDAVDGGSVFLIELPTANEMMVDG
ncbi:MAG: sensor histidine kinase, partial [Acidimicrobiales bacterium]